LAPVYKEILPNPLPYVNGIITKIVKLAENLTEAEALSLEAKLVDILGLRHYCREGWLVNMDEGKDFEARRNFYKTINPEISKILDTNRFPKTRTV